MFVNCKLSLAEDDLPVENCGVGRGKDKGSKELTKVLSGVLAQTELLLYDLLETLSQLKDLSVSSSEMNQLIDQIPLINEESLVFNININFPILR